MRPQVFIKICLLSVCCMSVLSGCIEDKGNYNYKEGNTVTFQTFSGLEYSFMRDTEFTIEPPIELKDPGVDFDSTFEIDWYIDEVHVHTGPKLTTTIKRVGYYALLIRVTNTVTGEVFITQRPYTIAITSGYDWGWMILYEEDTQSKLSFIDTDLRLFEDIYKHDDGILGYNPKNIYYYSIQGSIPSVSIAGTAKILINQGSGSVTLDSDDLKKDMYLKDEFSNGVEPDGLDIAAFANKSRYYAMHDRSGDIYLRDVGKDAKQFAVPYYGKYGSIPIEFDGGAQISVMASFNNIIYGLEGDPSCAYNVIMYDELNSRFLGFYRTFYTNPYETAFVYYNNYDQDFEDNFPAGLMRVNDMGAGTKVLAVSTYEGDQIEYDPTLSTNSHPISRYISLIDLYGAGDYYLHKWTVFKRQQNDNSHTIHDSEQVPFVAGHLLTGESIIKMPANFEKTNYMYFTDGDRDLYAYNIANHSYTLVYSAPDKIKGIYNSPVYNKFAGLGGNPTTPNHRIALPLDNGGLVVISVSPENLVLLFQGMNPDIVLKTFENAGDIKGMVWCNRGVIDEY